MPHTLQKNRPLWRFFLYISEKSSTFAAEYKLGVQGG